MSKKQNYILDYIKNLEIGSKVSIRSLAENLSVSEGTAYKAIKKAEELGFVHTRPRAGTIRISVNDSQNISKFTLNNIIKQLGLSIIISPNTNPLLSSIIIGDGSVNQLRKESLRVSGIKLCIVGDRPEIQSEALNLGMHILVTNNTTLSDATLSLAIEKKLYVLSSHHSCQNILYMIQNIDSYHHLDSSMDCVNDWMKTPQYLYYNDIVSDWYRTYFPIYALNDKYVVVDDDLKICGLLKASSILNSSPEEKISNLYERNIDLQQCTIAASASIHELAHKMVQENTELLFIEQNKQLKGFITANDVLRYYLYTGPHFSQQLLSSVELIEEIIPDQKRIYKIPEMFNEEQILDVLLEISLDHINYFSNLSGWVLNNSTFFNTEKNLSHINTHATSTIIGYSEFSCLCETETNTYKCLFNFIRK